MSERDNGGFGLAFFVIIATIAIVILQAQSCVQGSRLSNLSSRISALEQRR